MGHEGSLSFEGDSGITDKDTDLIEKRSRDAADARRRFLKTAGKVAIYTQPALMLLSQPGKACYRKSACGDYSDKLKDRVRKSLGMEKSLGLKKSFGLNKSLGFGGHRSRNSGPRQRLRSFLDKLRRMFG